MIIDSMYTTTISSSVCAVRLTRPLSFTHYGGFEYQAEVALLTRNILIQGDQFNSEPTDTQVGMHFFSFFSFLRNMLIIFSLYTHQQPWLYLSLCQSILDWFWSSHPCHCPCHRCSIQWSRSVPWWTN